MRLISFGFAKRAKRKEGKEGKRESERNAEQSEGEFVSLDRLLYHCDYGSTIIARFRFRKSRLADRL